MAVFFTRMWLLLAVLLGIDGVAGKQILLSVVGGSGVFGATYSLAVSECRIYTSFRTQNSQIPQNYATSHFF
jgi:hypothetical protein